MNENRAVKRLTAAAMGVILVTTLGVAPPSASAAPSEYTPARAQREKPVAGRTLLPGPATVATTGRPFTGAAPVWPSPGAAEVGVSASATSVAVAGLRLPVSVASVGPEAPRRLRVEALERGKPSGLTLRLSTLDRPGPVRVAIDYSGFRWAYGADWSSRLRLLEQAGCDSAGACQARPLATDNNVKAGNASATVTVGAAGTVVVLAAAPSGPAGDYSATPLSPSGTWSAGGGAGDFTWSYPLRMPPSLGGPVPAVGLSYVSSSVDGRTAASNNQPSLIGEGFDWSPGAVVRTYVPCGADRGDGANNTDITGDQCWLAENATISMAGRAGELIRDGANPNRWHLRTDDGTRVERRVGAGNGARDGEWWVATTTDGTQYWFGGKASSNSTLTVPVYGNHPNEPCHAAAFAASSCTQAYQWNLDHVVDTRGNTMTYFYAKETNKYARNMNPNDLASYDRSSHIVRIEYGTRTDRSETAPMRVLFGTDNRCLADCGNHDALHWPDTPWDQECTATPCGVPSPTFWSTKRLVNVTTRVGTQDVERWTLTHSFQDPGDGTRAGLWLEKISHAGLVGETVSTPDVTLSGIQLPNRVDAVDHSPAMNWWRVRTITTETGGKIDVTYSRPDCVAGSRVPDKNALQNNILRCYPVKWTPQGVTGPVTDFFHKYVVTDVVEADLTGGGTLVPTHYDYLGDPAWHYTDDNGLVPSNVNKTWSVWRGYGAVRTTKGDPGEQTVVENRFFRGMNGDHLPGGQRTVTLPAIAVGNIPAAADEDVFAGLLRESITYNGPGGPEVSATVFEPWQSAPTATRTRNGVTVHARYVAAGVNHTRVARDKGRPPLTTTTRLVLDDTYGMAVRAEDSGDDNVSGDERCTLTDYARNVGAWIVSTVSRVRGFAVSCAKALAGGLGDDDVISDARTFYDGLAHGAAPVRANVTRTETLKTYRGGNPEFITTSTSQYDSYGRVVSGTDTRGKVTATTPVPAAGGPVTGLTQVTNAVWTVRVTLDPAWGSPVSVVDENGRRTDLAYDGLGRLVSVWKPGRDKATQSPSFLYGYQLRNNAPSAVSTRTLTPDGGTTTSYTLYDSLLRVRQTQAPDAAGGPNAVITDTYHDSAGRAARVNSAYLSTVPAGTNLFLPTAVIPAQTTTRHDGAGREIASIYAENAPAGGSPGGAERWRTTTAYGGDRTDVTPPAGGTVTSTFVDVLGKTTELRQYHPGVAAGGDDPAGFDRTRYGDNRRGQLTQVTDAAGNAWTYAYDLLGQRIRSTDPDKATISSVFNDAGDMTSSTDSRDRTLVFGYDTLGRKTAMYSGSATPANRLAKWDYDTLPNGTRVAEQLVRTTRFVNGEAYVEEINGFTADYQPTSVTYQVPASQTGLAGSYTYVHTYHPDGSPATTRMPALGDLKTETLTYAYDAAGKPVGLDSTYGTSPRTGLVVATGYTSFGEVGAYTLRNNGGNAVDVTRTYETGTRRLAQIWTAKQTVPSTIADVRYSYDPVGNVTRLSDLTSGDHQCFRNDYLRRLTEAWTPASGDCGAAPATGALGGPARYWESYRYDVLGNRTSLIEHATPAGERTTNYSVPGGKHQVAAANATDGTSTTYSYDEVGNMLSRRTGSGGTQTMTWDDEGRLATSSDAAGTTSFVYDADGSRLIRKDPSGRTLYLPGQELRYTASGGARTGVRYYSHAGQTVAVRAAAGLTWLSGDAQGTVQISVAALNQAVSTRRQLPFGGSRNGAGTWPSAMDKGFVGGTNDNTGLVHLGAREYDPSSGRFVSRDPVVNTDDPQQINGYAYSNNAPVTTSDPTGKLGSASCPPGYVGGPMACSGTENSGPPPAPSSPPGPGKEHCTTQGSAANCVRPEEADGPCDPKNRSSSCGRPEPSPWDVMKIIWYSNGTRLVIYRNGRAQINGYLLPMGAVNPEEMASKVDDISDEDVADDPIATSAKVYANCNPQICTLEFYRKVHSDHQKMVDQFLASATFPSTNTGLCVGGQAFYGLHWGMQFCVYDANGAVFVTAGGSRGLGYSLDASVTGAQVITPTMSDLCGHAWYGDAGYAPVTVGGTVSDDGNPLTANAGVSVGIPTISVSGGDSYGWAVWQFGNGKFGDNICNN